VFDGSESEALGRIRRLAAAAGKNVDQEVTLAVATNEPRRLVAAANVYLRQSRQPEGQPRPRTEDAITRAAEAIMHPQGAGKVKAALEQLRQQRVTGGESLLAADGPGQQRSHRPGYQR
jgi:hypothetical protein